MTQFKTITNKPGQFPSSIPHWDSNSRPLNHVCPPLVLAVGLFFLYKSQCPFHVATIILTCKRAMKNVKYCF